MALNKERILSELGSVVNQLQSADCGCMGKLFSGSGQGSATVAPMQSYGGCHMGRCCHAHGHGSPQAGEPHSSMNNQCMNRPCMGMNQYPKLIADTYSYLNQNLMQPTVNEVYNDLKSISPANTIMNNPMASKMGLSDTKQETAGQGDMSGVTGGSPNPESGMNGMSPGYNMTMGMAHSNASQPIGLQNQYMGHLGQLNQSMGQNNQSLAQMGHSIHQTNQPASPMGGMGSQIVKMMMGDKSSKPAQMPMQNGQLTDSMLINAPQSPHGQVGVTPLDAPGTYGTSTTMHNVNYGQDNAGTYAQNPTTQHMSQPNNMNPNASGMGQNVQSAHPMGANRTYGQHTQGVKKFSEMFPGVMQGDLGFDPMAIAIQMNPANQQQAAMNSMKQLMNGNKVIDPKSSVMQPVINTANVANAAMGQLNNAPVQGTPMTQSDQQVIQNQLQPVQQQQPVQYQHLQQQPPEQQQQLMQHGQPMQQQQPSMQHQPQVINPNIASPTYQVPQQQVYTAATGSPVHYQQPSNNAANQIQQQPQQYQIQYQQIIDPNKEAVTNAPNLPGGYDMSNTEGTSPAGHMMMEPIFPADTLNNRPLTYSHHLKHQRNVNYNTLGQPVQLLDPKPYHSPEPTLPQTLSPQPIPVKPSNYPQAFSNVKNTVSKTSIMGKDNVGKTPSRNQLQHLYNQYKGSHSYTQQNINAPIHHHTHSEGKLHENVNTAAPRLVPVEKVGGDTLTNAHNETVKKLEQPSAAMGDVVADNKPQSDGPDKGNPMKVGKCRNGLQDMVYTSAPTTAAWSFHGYDRVPYSAGYKFRSRIR